MTYQQREEYIAPVCEVLVFEVEEAVTLQQSAVGPFQVYSVGEFSTEDDIDPDTGEDLW